MLKDVRVSKSQREHGIRENHRGYPVDKYVHVFGADTETVNGKPYTIQVVSENDCFFKFVDEHRIFRSFMKWVTARCYKNNVNLVFFHNLNFDIRALFWKRLKAIYDGYNEIKLETDGYVVRMLFGKVNQADIWEDLGGYICPKCPEPVPKGAIETIKGENGSGFKRVCTRHTDGEPIVKRNLGVKVRLLDSAAFCPPGSKSLAGALKIYDVPYKKMSAPAGLGERRLKSAAFKKYAMNDAYAARALGLKIMGVHKEYDISPCVSLPQLAARILRHHFFLPNERILPMPEACRQVSEFSYHAGKNGFYVPRGVYENVYEYDINSAFPKAMKDLPSMTDGAYRHVKRYVPGACGVYSVSGRAFGATVAAIFNHRFEPIKNGPFKNVWITGYEVETLQNNKDYRFRVNEGWVWRQTDGAHSPLREFVNRFWNLKNTAPKGPKRSTYKNILNSLYGKFAACVEKRVAVDSAFGKTFVEDPLHHNKYFVAGALYHPFIASQITGQVRRDLYRLEIAGKALHAATDSVKTARKLPTSTDLGGLKLEVYGRCYLFRTKLYLHFSKDNSICGHDLKKGWIWKRGSDAKLRIFDKPAKKGEKPQHLCKWALHGFKGHVEELFDRRFELLNKGYLDYEYKHMVNLREGVKRGEPVSTMIKRQERLLLPS